jgi:hypothetical protein
MSRTVVEFLKNERQNVEKTTTKELVNSYYRMIF